MPDQKWDEPWIFIDRKYMYRPGDVGVLTSITLTWNPEIPPERMAQILEGRIALAVEIAARDSWLARAAPGSIPLLRMLGRIVELRGTEIVSIAGIAFHPWDGFEPNRLLFVENPVTSAGRSLGVNDWDS